jgi:hypothetical protein
VTWWILGDKHGRRISGGSRETLAKEDERTKAAPRGRSPGESGLNQQASDDGTDFFCIITKTGTVASLPVFSIIFTDEVTKARVVPASVKHFCPSVKLDYIVVYLYEYQSIITKEGVGGLVRSILH